MLEVVTRRFWHAANIPPAPLGTKRSVNVFVTHTRTFECDDVDSCSAVLRFMQNSAKHHKGIPDIPFNFLIGGDGRVYEGRGFGVMPTLPAQHDNMKDNSLYFGYMLRYTFDPIPDIMQEAFYEFLDLGCRINRIDYNYKLIDLDKQLH